VSECRGHTCPSGAATSHWLVSHSVYIYRPRVVVQRLWAEDDVACRIDDEIEAQRLAILTKERERLEAEIEEQRKCVRAWWRAGVFVLCCRSVWVMLTASGCGSCLAHVLASCVETGPLRP
jgi:hypothetical protein